MGTDYFIVIFSDSFVYFWNQTIPDIRMNKILESVNRQLGALKVTMRKADFDKGQRLYISGACQILTYGKNRWEVLVVALDEQPEELLIVNDENGWFCLHNKVAIEWSENSVAALFQIRGELQNTEPKIHQDGKTYTREGMIKRVLAERREKADKSEYKITFADNIYGEHTLINEKGVRYKITLRDFENETGYIDNPDLKTNKLGTTKHLMFAFKVLKSDKRLIKRLGKTYPFIEIYSDPLNDYRITWFYPHKMKTAAAALIQKYFGENNYIEEENVKDFLLFIRDAREIPAIKIRMEVEQKVERAWTREMLKIVEKTEVLDFSLLRANLFPYQKKGVCFATFREGAIIADEMGLGKTLQAIGAAVMKKALFGFKRCLVICPASLKDQWKQEIEKYSNEQVVVVEGLPDERKEIYENSGAYFMIANYETVLRDVREMNKMDTDLVILDEAQRIKNFSTVTAQNIKRLKRKHSLVITGTPLENRLIDLYSIVGFADPEFLAPLWEFSYQHCYFDRTKKDKIVGYYDLQKLNKRLQPILLRREKSEVIRDLPQVTEITVPVSMHPVQMDYHTSFAKGVASILAKKFISPYDWQKLMLLLNNMRLACDSSYLIDKETYHSPKLIELEHILLEKLDLKNNGRKIIIFSEWITMLNLIGRMLRDNAIGYVQLSGKVKVGNRKKLIKKFESEAACQVFLSSEAGGSGLNLQVADTVINFELPWNPAKKNQRIGRIDRLGQRSNQLTVLNFVTLGSIEVKIASGLSLKQSLFDGVLNDNGDDEVDFSAAGRAQFIKEIEAALAGMEVPQAKEGISEDVSGNPDGEAIEELIAEEHPSHQGEDSGATPTDRQPEAKASQPEEIEKVLSSGMDFLSGLLRMATGKDSGLKDGRVELNKQTGEVVMRFKLPLN